MGAASSSSIRPPHSPPPTSWPEKALISGPGITLGLAWPDVPSGTDQQILFQEPLSDKKNPPESSETHVDPEDPDHSELDSSAETHNTYNDNQTLSLPLSPPLLEAILFYSQLVSLEKEDSHPRETTHFQDIPPECQLAILGNLRNLSDWCRFKLVCRRFRQLADFSVQSLEISEGEEVPALQLANGLKPLQNLVCLRLLSQSVNDTEDGVLCAISLCCKKLRKLHLGNFWNWSPYVPYDDVAFLLLFHQCKFLEEVEIVWEGGDKPVPPSLWKLRYLKRFVGYNWSAFNRIPSEIGQLSSLKEIGLFGAEIRHVPREFWKLTGLEKLVFESVLKMDGIAKQIGVLTNLRHLAIESLSKPSKQNQLHLSLSLVQLSNLEALTLVNCLDMPAQNWKPVSKLQNLKELQLGIASSAALPDIFWLSDWRNTLSSLTVQGEKFEMLPDSIFHLLPELKVFRVVDCVSVNWFSPQVSNLTKLTELEIDGGFESLPDSLGQLSSLQILKVGPANLISELPYTIGNLRTLRKVYLNCPTLLSIPKSFFELTGLEDLQLATRSLGLLPESLQSLANLWKLEISSEEITWLPTAVGSLRKLLKLSIEGPNIGYLPSTIGNLVGLKVLALRNCGVVALPSSLSTLSSLRRLDIDCGKTQSLPNTLGNLKSLTRLLILNAAKVQEIPHEVGALSRLRRLALVNCITITELPDTLGRLSNLVRLDILMCTSLVTLPDSICKLKLMYLVLQSLWKLGKLPECLGEMTSLVTFHVQDCPILDKIPASLSRLQGMRDTIVEETVVTAGPPTVVENRMIE